MLLMFNQAIWVGIRPWVLKWLDGHFKELLHILNLKHQSCSDVGNSGQINIPVSIDQVLDGHIYWYIIRVSMTDHITSTAKSEKENVIASVPAWTTGNYLLAAGYGHFWFWTLTKLSLLLQHFLTFLLFVLQVGQVGDCIMPSHVKWWEHFLPSCKW